MCVCWPTSSVRACEQCACVSLEERACVYLPKASPAAIPSLARSVQSVQHFSSGCQRTEFLSRSPTHCTARPARLPFSQCDHHHPPSSSPGPRPNFHHHLPFDTSAQFVPDSFASPIVSCKCWDLDRAAGKQSRRYHPARSYSPWFKHNKSNFTRREGITSEIHRLTIVDQHSRS